MPCCKCKPENCNHGLFGGLHSFCPMDEYRLRPGTNLKQKRERMIEQAREIANKNII